MYVCVLTSLNRYSVSRCNVVITSAESRYNVNTFKVDITCRYKVVVITWVESQGTAKITPHDARHHTMVRAIVWLYCWPDGGGCVVAWLWSVAVGVAVTRLWLWLCGCLAVWLCGWVAMLLSGWVAGWLGGWVAMVLCGYCG